MALIVPSGAWACEQVNPHIAFTMNQHGGQAYSGFRRAMSLLSTEVREQPAPSPCRVRA